MTLDELEWGCRVFGEMAGDDRASDDLRLATGGDIDLTDPAHAKAMLVWLNKWGSRQFAIAHHDAAAVMLGDWGALWMTRLPRGGESMSNLRRGRLEVVADAYDDARGRAASFRPTKSGGIATVTVGATGAAKLLHALRPKALPPWDEPIRASLGLDGGRDSYLAWLLRVQQDVRDVQAEARARGITNVPRALGRPTSSLPKMIDECYWVTLTRRLSPDRPLDHRERDSGNERAGAPRKRTADRRP